MRFTKPKETLPALRSSLLPAPNLAMVPAERSVVYPKLIAVIPPKVSNRRGLVDPDDLGKKVDVFV